MTEPRRALRTRNFVLLCLLALTAFSSFYFLLATLPVYVEGMGGSEAEVGLVLATFSATAVLLRPWIGKAADRRGARRLIIAGAIVLALSSVAYIATRSVPSLLVLRVIHGAGWAAFGTAASAMVANVAPPERRGEAMGYYGMFSNLAMATGPAIGEWLIAHVSFPAVFIAAAMIAAAAAVLALALRESPPLRGSIAAPPDGPLIERSAVLPSAVYGLLTITYGTVVSFVPLYAAKSGIGAPSYFFSAYAVTLLATRSFTGKLSDRFGRGAVIVPGIILAAAALSVLALAHSLAALVAAAVLYGLAFASLQPAMLALVTDRAPAGRRGAAMGTFTTAIDTGIACGAALGGLLAGRFGYEAVYAAAALVALGALVVFVGTTSLRAHARV